VPILIISAFRTPFKQAVIKSLKKVGLFAVLLYFAMLSTNLLIKEKLNPWFTIAIWDIAGVQSQRGKAGRLVLQAQPLVNDIDGLQKYNCLSSDDLLFGSSPLFNVRTPYSEGSSPGSTGAAHLMELWKNSVLGHPVLYLKHRYCVGRV